MDESALNAMCEILQMTKEKVHNNHKLKTKKQKQIYLRSCHSFLRLVMLPCSFCLHVFFFKHLYSFICFFYKSSRMRSISESREFLAAAATDVSDTPRLWGRGVLGEFCFSLLGGSAFKSSRAPKAAMENSGSPVVSKSNTQDWKYTSSTCRVSLHFAVARSTV